MDIKEQYEGWTMELKKTIPFKAFPNELPRSRADEVSLKN